MEKDRISVEAVVAVTERSRSTWWRRLSDGGVTRLADDERGRTMLSMSEVIPHISASMTPEDRAVLVRADAGDAAAQNDMGQFFAAAGMHKAAIYWILQAAKQEHPDAMQWLGRCYLSGEGVPKDENLGVMWIAKAAAHGHVIAQAQMNGLHPRQGSTNPEPAA
jgi:TPR repeat protein